MQIRIALIAALALMLTPALLVHAGNKDVDNARGAYQQAQDEVARKAALNALVATQHEEAVDFIVGRIARENDEVKHAEFMDALAGFSADKPLKALLKAAEEVKSEEDHQLAHHQCDLFTALARNRKSDLPEKSLRKMLDDQRMKPWATLALVEAIRAADVADAGTGRRFIAEVRALLDKKQARRLAFEIVTVNVLACLKQLTPKDSPAERNATVKAVVEWQAWSHNTQPRLQDMADRVLHHLTGETCTLNDETLKFWRWWLANSPDQPDKPKQQARGTATLFDQPALGDHIVFVIDVSDSMKYDVTDEGRAAIRKKSEHLDWDKIKSKLDLARQELIYSINQLNPGSDAPDARRPRFAIIAYSDRIYGCTNGWLVADDAGCKEGVEAAEKLEIKFTTNIHDGLARAFAIHDGGNKADHPDTTEECVLTGAHTIVFLTDGFATANEDKKLLEPENIRASIRRLNRFRKVVINTVGIGNHDDKLMPDLSDDSGGKYTDWTFKENVEEKKGNFGLVPRR
ncbi:MAG: VWA domain-containing protein [Planctomycetes bacterium]|nr:VWA domain-containing protein [Planctomycetota bacterium]